MATATAHSHARSGLSETRYNALLKLVTEYERESRICAKNHAYYGACVMLGAALEGGLMALCSLYPTEASKAISRLKKSKNLTPKGSALRWSLAKLIAVGTETGWLPARKSKYGRLKIGDAVDLMRELRNFVHPGKHLREYPKIRIGARHYRDARAVFEAAISWLHHRVEQDIWKWLKREEAKTKRHVRHQ